MLRTALPLLLSAVLALFAACTRPATSTATRAMSLAAEGLVEVAPDEATFLLYLTAEERSSRAAGDRLRTRAADLHVLLGTLGVDSADRQTLDLRLDKRYRWNGQRQVFEGYTASTSLQVRLRDLDLLPRVYDELLEDTELTLQGLRYGHSAMDSLRRAAHLEALAEADALADALLAATGDAGKRVIGISNDPGRAPRTDVVVPTAAVAQAEAREMDAAGGGFASSAGVISVRTRLWVDYLVE